LLRVKGKYTKMYIYNGTARIREKMSWTWN